MAEPTQLGLSVSELEMSITGRFLSGGDLLRVSLQCRDSFQFSRVTRAWISEGIPFAYKTMPLTFEAIRDWISNRFGVAPRDVTLVGSARLSFSATDDYEDYGRPFRPGSDRSSSDLDLAIVSKDQFDACTASFQSWQADVLSGRFIVTDEYQKDNIERLPRNIRNGFIDPHKIVRTYGKIQPILFRMETLTKMLNASKIFPSTRKASVRIYKDWPSFDAQMMKNIQSLKPIAAAKINQLQS